MKHKRASQGFTLIEMIFFIVIAGISLAGIVPLYNTVLVNLHVLNDGMQAEYLGLEMVETLVSANAGGAGFANLTEANFPSQTGIDLGGTLRFDRVVQIEGMIPGQQPNPCTGLEYNGESFKCLTVTVAENGSGQVLFKQQMVNADLPN
ncbi:MAG: type II secretion system protein [Magnetococcales bacterium]|nr:type II secretion system protein [Magnetococcales bacterium]